MPLSNVLLCLRTVDGNELLAKAGIFTQRHVYEPSVHQKKTQEQSRPPLDLHNLWSITQKTAKKMSLFVRVQGLKSFIVNSCCHL